MKRLIFGLLSAGVLSIGSPAAAMQPLTDYHLRQVAAQAYVVIEIDNVSYYQSIGKVVWTDTDGTDGTPGSIELTDSEISLTFRAIFDGSDRNGYLQHAYGEESLFADIGFTALDYSGMVIETTTTPPLHMAIASSNGQDIDSYSIPAVVATPATIETYVEQNGFVLRVTSEGAINSGEALLQYTQSDLTTAILSGHVEISPK